MAFVGNEISNNSKQPENILSTVLNELAEVGIITTYKLLQFWNIPDWLVQVTTEGSLTYSNKLNVPFPITVLSELK